MNFSLPGNLISTGLALLAFVVAFYVLLARERKTPYIINFIFLPAGMLLFGLVLAFWSELIRVGGESVPIPPSSSYVPNSPAKALVVGAITFFSLGLLLTLSNIWRLHNRQVNFRDDHGIKNARLYRWMKRKRRQWSDKLTYAQTTVDLDSSQIQKALTASGLSHEGFGNIPNLQTIAICRQPLQTTDPQLESLCIALINDDWYVQYTTCIRHPWEFTKRLVEGLAAKKNELVKRIVVVDAYTPHFGFTDSVHEDKTVQLKKLGMNYVAAGESYAGLHTAAAKAFNTLKQLDASTRRPTLVIYEGSGALSDIESTEQYRIFARHVLSSERMWGGMLTLFVEPAIGSAEIDLLRTYADLFFAPSEVTGGKPV